MTWMDNAPARVIRRRETFELDDRRLRKKTDAGELVRVAPGSFVARAEWTALRPLDQHALRVWEAAARLAPGALFVNAAAAAIHEIDLLGLWPDRVEVAVQESSGSRTSGLIQRRSRRHPVVEVVPWGQHYITTPARTALDIAASRPFPEGVAAVDQVLWDRRQPQALGDLGEMSDVLAAFTGRGATRAGRVVDFATTGAANVRESQSRVLIAELGFPPPVVQQRLVLRSGRVVYPDFWWPYFRIAGELDGLLKYRDPVILAGRSPEQALADEKDRGDELRREVAAVARWRVRTLEHPRELWDILTASGLPSSRPRPGR